MKEKRFLYRDLVNTEKTPRGVLELLEMELKFGNWFLLLGEKPKKYVRWYIEPITNDRVFEYE